MLTVHVTIEILTHTNKDIVDQPGAAEFDRKKSKKKSKGKNQREKIKGTPYIPTDPGKEQASNESAPATRLPVFPAVASCGPKASVAALARRGRGPLALANAHIGLDVRVAQEKYYTC
jgi:hypothetical protein